MKITAQIRKMLAKHVPVKGKIVDIDAGLKREDIAVYIDFGTFVVHLKRYYKHRKTALRAARNIVERINRRGVEVEQ